MKSCIGSCAGMAFFCCCCRSGIVIPLYEVVFGAINVENMDWVEIAFTIRCKCEKEYCKM